jgi:hypothetical protein
VVDLIVEQSAIHKVSLAAVRWLGSMDNKDFSATVVCLFVCLFVETDGSWGASSSSVLRIACALNLDVRLSQLALL